MGTFPPEKIAETRLPQGFSYFRGPKFGLDNVIRLEGKADTGSSYRLTGMNYRTWGGFESVRWVGGTI